MPNHTVEFKFNFGDFVEDQNGNIGFIRICAKEEDGDVAYWVDDKPSDNFKMIHFSKWVPEDKLKLAKSI